MNYLRNFYLWWTGFKRFGELTFYAGWSADQWRWKLLYVVDYGTHVLTGGAVVSWSRWFYEHRARRIPGFFNRLLNHFEDGHGSKAGTVLWGSVDCAWYVRMTATVALLPLLVLLVPVLVLVLLLAMTAD